MMTEDRRATSALTLSQAKDADSPVLRTLLAQGKARLNERIGDSDMMVVNLPLSAVTQLSQSGLINYMSPDRAIEMSGHVEDTTGVTLTRSQAATPTRPAYTLDGTGIGVAIVDSGIYADHKGFKTCTLRASRNVNFTSTTTTATLKFGHGTHFAGRSRNATHNGAQGIAPKLTSSALSLADTERSTSWL